MPVIKFKGHRFFLRWKPEWDAIILSVVKKYTKNGRTNWLLAQEKGMFKNIPVGLKTIRLRPSAIKRKSDEEWKKKDSEYSKKRQKKNRIKLRKQKRLRASLIKSIPLPPNPKKWTKDQIKLLRALAKACRRGKLVDWKTVLKDPRTANFPTRVPNCLSRFLHKLRHPAKNYHYPPKPISKAKRKQYLQARLEKRKQANQKIREFLYGIA